MPCDLRKLTFICNMGTIWNSKNQAFIRPCAYLEIIQKDDYIIKVDFALNPHEVILDLTITKILAEIEVIFDLTITKILAEIEVIFDLTITKILAEIEVIFDLTITKILAEIEVIKR